MSILPFVTAQGAAIIDYQQGNRALEYEIDADDSQIFIGLLAAGGAGNERGGI